MKTLYTNRLFLFAANLLVSVSAFAQPGDLVKFVDRPAISKPELDQTLPKMCPGIKAAGIDSIRYLAFTYETITVDGRPTVASGALFVPSVTTRLYPIVSYQHWTTVERRLAPSSGLIGSEGRSVGACYASQGAIVVMADYLGYGDSTEYHPYLHADSEASASADAIQAAKSVIGRLNYKLRGKLFLAGYSQGGHSTLALQRHLEARKVRVTAVSPMAGPYDLSGTVIEALKTPDPAASTEAAFILLSYKNAYSLFPTLEHAIRPQYTKGLANLLPGDKSFADVMSVLPSDPRDLLQPEFLKDLISNPQSQFMAALRKNDLLDWTPVAPIMLIHGTTDIQVPISNTIKAEKAFRDRGANAHAVWINDKDHEHAAPQAFAESIKWFNSFL